ncbi:MAG: MBL fold metallo-hydrolase [Methanomassiliicoccales archaeon]|jgi:beta-lactamase superfamily II metal-dependent hydrolase
MRRGTKVLLVIIVVAALVALATVKPLSSTPDRGTETAASIKALFSDATTATIGLNGTTTIQSLDLNGAVVSIGELKATGTDWRASWTIASTSWQGSVQRLGTSNLSAIVIDQDNDRRMGPDDRIQIRRDVTGMSPSMGMIVDVKFAGGIDANCSFTFAQTSGSSTLVSFIDVGQGDSILITTADSRTILIDAGPPLAAGVLVSYLHNRSVSVIDALIVTHPDADHLGGAADVLRDFTVLSVYHPGQAKNTSAYSSFIHAAQDEGCPIHTAVDTHVGDYLGLTASATIEVLNIDPTASDVNDASIVLEMRTPGKSFLFTGDISSDVESNLIANHSFDLNIDVLKVAHHGSKYSTSDAFLDATTPEIGVISVGENTYGHPANDTLSRLFAHNVTVLRTDQMGTIDIIA